MKGGRFFLIQILQSGIGFLVACLFVILFFRLFPDKILLVFPASFVLGLLFGVLSYLPLKYFIEKQ